MGSGWVHISPLPVPYSYFKIGENPSNRGWFGRIPMGMDFVVMPAVLENFLYTLR